MCGRLNCYCRYSSYSDRLAKKLQPLEKGERLPEWVDPSKFRPSPNIAPTLCVPVLYVESGRLVIRPMKWGISLPHVSNVVHNVRIETMSSSKFFQNLMLGKQTCAVLCDGFYEWKGKKPYFFYDGDGGFDGKIARWSEDEWTRKGPPVMALAGVYHKEELTCAVITREASETSQIHHRITILLSTKKDIIAWLSPDPHPQAKLSHLSRLQNFKLSFYEVNDKVNSSKYQGNDCHVPKSKTSGPLDQWFSRSKGVSNEPKDASNVPKGVPDVSDSSSQDTLNPNKRKSSTDLPVSRKKSNTPQKNRSSKSLKSPTHKSGGPLDRWFSKTNRHPE